MTQNKRIIGFMKLYRIGITSLGAFRMSPPIMRLASRIHELESYGYTFEKRKERNYKTGSIYTGYYLVSEPKREDRKVKGNRLRLPRRQRRKKKDNGRSI